MRTFIMLALCWWQATAVMAQKDHFFIYLCFGQTNMVGHGALDEEDLLDIDQFYSLSAINGKGEWKQGKWRKAVPPLCGPDSGASLVDYFGYTMRRNLPETIKIGIVYVAVDDTEIDLFDKNACKAYIKSIKDERVKAQIAAYGGNPYERLVSTARKAQREGEIRGILMHHGETTKCDDAWVKKVCKIHDDLMHDLKLDPTKVPFVVGETVDEEHEGRYAASNVFINKLPDLLPTTYVAKSVGCDASADKVHFLTLGYYTLGIRYGIQMLRGMGMGFEGSDDYLPSTSGGNDGEEHVHEMIDVDGFLGKDGIFRVKATMPVVKVKLLDANHQPFKTLIINGEMDLELDATVFPASQNPIFEFYGKNGTSVEVEVQQ